MKVLSQIDLKFFLPAAFLVLLGTIILSSVSPGSFPQHLFHVGIAFFIFLLFSQLDLRVLRELSPWLYILILVFLVVTLIIGAVTRGAVRWISLGPINIQPSEIAKPFLVLFFAWFFARSQGIRRYIVGTLYFLPAAALVLIQPDLGSSIVVTAGFLGVLFFSGAPLRFLGAASLLLLLFSPLSWGFLADYQKERIISFINPGADPLGSGYNSIQAMIAVGSGGITGKGLGQGSQSQLAFLPERHTDFIFASLSEELGLLGAGLVVLAFAFIFLRAVILLQRTDNLFLQSLLGGVFTVIFVQTAINIGMNLGILPITGIPLPFVSAGGSSLVSMAASLGIASSVSRLKESEPLAILRQG